MLFLTRFLYKNLKGYRNLVILAILIIFAQVGSNLIAAMPLKFIPSKINNPGSDPACTFPFLDGILTWFDTPNLDPSLAPLATPPNQPSATPPPAPCPANPSNPETVLHPRITMHSVNGVIVFSLIVLVVFGSLSAFLIYLELKLATYIAQYLSARLREQLFDHLQRLTLDWHAKQKKGDLVQRLTGNIADIEKLVSDGLVDLLAGVLTLLGVAVIMLLISPEYALLSLAITPVLFLMVYIYTGGMKKAARNKAQAADKIADLATEDLNALTVVRAFTLESREQRRFGSQLLAHRTAGLRAGYLQARFIPFVTVLMLIGTVSIIGIGGYVAAGNSFNAGSIFLNPSSIDVGTLILFLIYLRMLYQPMRDLSKLTNLASNAALGVERIQDVLAQDIETTTAPISYQGPKRLRGEITFERVVFGYSPEQPILRGLSFQIPAGRKVALVGSSGGGKTTIAKLIPRFYELQNGTLKIDGVDTRLYPLALLRQNISLVSQESVFFEGTIRDNLTLGSPDVTPEQLMDAARMANIHKTIMNLPAGYETLVREQGNNFSASQRQRLSIARAILRDAPILILDEPTASLDVKSDAEVMHALITLMEGRTVLTISHHLSTLRQVDEILVIHDGLIVERGSFESLKQQKGLFAHLFYEQIYYNHPEFLETSPHMQVLIRGNGPLPPVGARSLPWEAVEADLYTPTLPVPALDPLHPYELEEFDDPALLNSNLTAPLEAVEADVDTPTLPVHALNQLHPYGLKELDDPALLNSSLSTEEEDNSNWTTEKVDSSNWTTLSLPIWKQRGPQIDE